MTTPRQRLADILEKNAENLDRKSKRERADGSLRSAGACERLAASHRAEAHTLRSKRGRR